MATYNKDCECNVESLISIFTVDDGVLKVLLLKKDKEPYKGYWALPTELLKTTDTLEDSITNCVYQKTGIPSLFVKQCYTFSTIDRCPDNRTIGVSYLGLVDSVTLLVKQEHIDNVELGWFNIKDLPKLAYDHEDVFNKAKELLGKEINNVNIIKKLFPSDFTLPELQRVYEQVLGITIDRRNFRKKFVEQNLIEDTLEFNDGGNGRPAKLYRFKDNLKDTTIL